MQKKEGIEEIEATDNRIKITIIVLAIIMGNTVLN